MTNEDKVKADINALSRGELAALLMGVDDLDDRLHFCPRGGCISGQCRPCLEAWLEREAK